VSRLHQVVLIGSLLPLSWLGVMAVHESGHVSAAWLTGGRVTKVVLHPLTISRTDVDPNPHPVVVTWAGPAVGALLPLAAFAAARLARMPGTPLVRFFAGFCLIANGTYLGMGVFHPVGDADKLLQYGARTWQLAAFGLVMAPLGLFLWHGQGPHFGLGKAGGRVQPAAAYFCLVLLVVAVTAAFLLSGK
jgi:hypothetical protein